MARHPLVATLYRLANRLAEPVVNHPRVARLAGVEPIRIRYRGRRSGAPVELPAWARRRPDGLLVAVAAPSQKVWWRNFRGHPHPLEVRLDGTWRPGTGLVHEPAPGKVEVHVTWQDDASGQ